jgi:hypothetical protein
MLHADTGLADTASAATGLHEWYQAGGGATMIDTANKKFGTAGLHFRGGVGSADYISVANSSDFTLGSGDFTIDCWFKLAGTDSTLRYMCGQALSNDPITASTSSFTVALNTSHNLQANFFVGSTTYTITGNTFFTADGSFHHVAVVRSGSSLLLFVDGVIDINAAVSINGTVNATSNNFSVGLYGFTGQGVWWGWIDEFRLSVGLARWTTNFKPPKAAYGNLANDGSPLPDDFLMYRRVTWTGSPRRELVNVHPSYFQASYPSRPADVPAFFTIEDNTLEVMPLDNTAIEFEYFAKVPALATLFPADGTQHNWLLDSHPDAYLFGAMAEAEMFGVNDERMPLWKARRDEIFDEIEKLSNKSRAPSSMRVMGPTP